jgi:photosystem II stability/assembly factor-like uncharacterized protein
VKRLLACLVILVSLLACASLAAAGSARAAGAPAQPAWTVAIYVNGDNDLYYAWPRFTRPALRRIPASADVNVVAMLDKPKKDGAWLYKFSGPTVTTVKHYTAERDFGSGATFQWFLGQVHQRFPSDHVVVVCWDHGYGWRYFSKDDTSNDRITMPELRAALAGAGLPIDILSFDACNMGDVEVAWDVASVPDPADPGAAPLVDYLVGSEETIDQDGFPYDDMFAPLAADPGRSVAQVTQDMLRGQDAYYGSLRCFDWVSLSAVDLQAVKNARGSVSHFVDLLRSGLAVDKAKYGAAYRDALAGSIYAWDSWQVDLGMFADQLIAGHQLDDDTALLAAAAEVRDAVRGGMVTGVTSGSYARWFEGLTVWAGTGADWAGDSAAYKAQSLFGASSSAGGAGWYGFLKAYNASGEAVAKEPDPQLPRATYGLTDVFFKNAQHGWATGYDNVKNEAVILRTVDGGDTWTTKRPTQNGAYMLSSLTQTPGGALWSVGSEGWYGSAIVRSLDHGATWRQTSSPTLQYQLGVDAVGSRTGFIAATGGVLLRTVDAGAVWKKVAGAPKSDLFGLDFQDADHGWVLADDGAAVTGSVQRTDDGGATWTKQAETPGALLYAIDSVGQNVWVAGGDPAAGGLLGGERVSGDGIILHSPDGGATWSDQLSGVSLPRINAIDMVDADVGWAVGDGSFGTPAEVLRTINGGATWEVKNPGVSFDLAAVHAVDAQTAWVVGDGEAILSTTDGGATWQDHRGDVIGPRTQVESLIVRRGAAGVIRYQVEDAQSDTALVTIRVRDANGRVVSTWDLGWRRCEPVKHSLLFRCVLPRGVYTMRASAVDQAGNAQSAARGGTLTVR